MALAQTTNQILRSAGEGTAVVANSPITGDGTSQSPLGIDENWHGNDGESVTFTISAIPSGHRVTLSGAQGTESFDVMNGATGPSGAQGETGPQGPEGPQGPSGAQGPSGQNGIDGVSPVFRFSEDDEGVTVYVSGAQGEDSFRLYNANSGHTYSAGPNIDIYPVEDQLYISGKDWTDDIESAISSVSSDYYPMTGNPSGFLTAHQDITNLDYVQNSALDYTPSMLISGISGHELYAESANHAFTAETANYVEGGWEYDEHNNISSYNGSAFVGQNQDTYDVSAGANINVATAGNTFTVSGKDWSTDISNAATAGSAAATAWVENQNYLTAHQSLAGLMSASKLEYDSSNKISGYDGSAFAGENREIIPVIGDNGISVTEVSNNVVIEISSVAHDNTISGNGTVASPLGVVGGGGIEYSAGANINITNHVVSSKDWTDDITAASAYAASQAQGKTYTGIAPIVVNNIEDKISANCIELSAGNGIDSDKLALGVIEVSSQGGGSNFSTSAFGVNPSLQVTALTSVSYYDTGVGNSNQLSGNNTNNLGWTMPSAYANVKNDIITETMPEVSSHYSYLLSYTTPVTGFTSNSGLEIRKYVGNTGTTRKVLSGNSTVGELVPEDYTSRQYLTTNAAGNMQWSNISDLTQIVLVATSGDIPASGATDGKLYVVTGT